MRAVVQRVSRGSVSIEGKIVAEIDRGLVVFLGVGREDKEEDAEYLINKIANLRIFEDQDNLLNLSLLDIKGKALIVSQFTLFGDCRKGRRPSFSEAAAADKGMKLYQHFISGFKNLGIDTVTGIFQTDMQVEIINEGPVTMLLDSKKTF
ncbi:MAG: D-tyrosyl-tRNA(Tyr) deacylase [Peptococcaceae bacterium]|nr:D-tyrosyl-tRNA(Tyr) deacylase [Peptococcaceae bacterium]